jgi:hypothetical protein
LKASLPTPTHIQPTRPPSTNTHAIKSTQTQALGIPVRMLRRNDDTDSSTDTSLFYDGIYDVVGWLGVTACVYLLAGRWLSRPCPLHQHCLHAWAPA